MTGFFIFVHTFCCLMLIATVLMQSGRGGGLTEGFAPAESMFGAKTNEFMIRTTIVLSSIFLVTCLTLARLSAQKEKSLIPETFVAQKSSKATITGEVEEKAEKTADQETPSQEERQAEPLVEGDAVNL